MVGSVKGFRCGQEEISVISSISVIRERKTGNLGMELEGEKDRWPEWGPGDVGEEKSGGRTGIK